MDLVNENIVLRKARLSDLESIYKNIWSDLEVAKTMFYTPLFDFNQAMERLNRIIEFQSKHETAFYIALKETDEAIGVAGIKKENEHTYQEAGIGIGRSYQHKGYGKEVLSLLLKLAFSDENIDTFNYYAMKDNTPSINLAKHFNMHYVSENKEIREYDKKEFIIVKYSITKEEYLNNLVY